MSATSTATPAPTTSMSRDTAAVRIVAPGERFRLTVEDWCFGRLSSDAETYDAIKRPRCPVSGPVDIAGAEVGDTLAITIHEVRLESLGTVARLHGVGPMAPDQTRVYDASVERSGIEVAGLRFAFEPMIGMLGVRPDSAEPVLTRWTGRHGGNLDTREITEGSIVELPVLTSGGGIWAGDLHAAMGDGELTGTGVECRGEIVLSADVRRSSALHGPRIRLGNRWLTLETGHDFKAAVAGASAAMREWIQSERGVDAERAALIIGFAGGVGVSQVVNPAGVTVKVFVDWDKVDLPA